MTTAVGILHHFDHVLRHNHSGWPFRPEVNVFTYSLSVYLIISALLLARPFPRVRIALSALLVMFPTIAHIVVETPAEQYRTWAHEPGVNLLGVSAPAVGITAVFVTCLLSLSAMATFLALVRSRGV